jgi:hypothetical protein
MKADANGFLIADRAVSVESLAGAMKGVKGDTAAILALLKVGARATITQRARVLNSGASRGPSAGLMGERLPPPSVVRDETGKSLARVAAALARERDERGRFKPYPTAELTEVAKAVKDMTRRQAAEHAEEKRERAKRSSKGAGGAQSGPESPAQASGASNGGKPPRGPQSGSATPLQAGANTGNADATRDARGRFVGKGGGAGEGGDGASNAGGGRAKREREGGEGFLSKLKGLFTGFKSPNMPGVEGYDKVDPTVEASKELGSMIKAPLAAVGTVGKAVVGRGFSAASKLPAAPWYRRILRELHMFRGESSAFGNAETRVLKEIERKTGGGKTEGKGMLASLAGGVGSLFGGRGIMSLLKRGGGGLLGLGKNMLKRLPLLGALFAGGSALASIFGPGDPNKSPEQNRTDRFTGAGSGIGAIIGGGLGMFLGPVGAMIGGVIGDRVGELVGAWLATVDWSKVGETITGAWDGAVKWIKDEWKVVTDKLDGITKAVGDAWTAVVSGISTFLKDKLGLDLGPVIDGLTKFFKPAVDKAKELGGKAVDGAKAVGGAVAGYVADRGAKMAEPIARTGGALMEWGEGIYSKLDKGYRRKQSFDGIKGGDGLAKYGSYTDDEAAKIRELKRSGANTSANLAGGMPADVRDKIVAAALKNGLDPKTMLEFASMESGGNANAISSTGAAGIFQFTGATASGVGIKDRFNADQNIQGGMQLANANAAMLQKSGLPVNAANLYMMHQLGPGAAKEIIQGAKDGKSISQLSDSAQKAVSLNYGAGSKTAADYLAKNSAALEARGKSVVGDMSNLGGTLPAPTVAVAAASPPPAPPVPPSPVAPATAPPTVAADIPQPLNSPGPIDVRVSQDSTVGQDLSDRRLAQIATGGISA